MSYFHPESPSRQREKTLHRGQLAFLWRDNYPTQAVSFKMNLELIGITLYVLAMLVLGFYVSKRIKTDDDYFLAGRSLGPFLATFSIFATWFGAETCIGTAGSVYRHGLGSIQADPVGYSICILLMGFIFSRILWNKKITTIPDLYRERFSPNTERMAALIMIPSSLVWAGAQIRAFGQILHSTTDFGVTVAITVAALVVVIYTISGGLLADAYTDLIQGFALIAGLIFLMVAMIMDMGGLSTALASIPRERLTFSFERDDLSVLGKLELWMVPILGSLMSQELVSRVVASKSAKVAHHSALRAGTLYLAVGGIPIMIGLLGINYLPNLQESETIMPLLAKTHLSPFFYIIFIGALVSAILSTVDSTLLSASALASHNLIFPAMKNLTERKKVIVARLGVLISGGVAYVIAFLSESITDLVETASSLGGPSILIITSIALFSRRGNGINAIFAMTMSILAWALSHYVWEVEFPIILTVVVCGLSYFMSLPFTNLIKGRASRV
jgi:solute:Na+ symporter, SSS family